MRAQVNKLYMALRAMKGYNGFYTQSYAVGDGEWSLEVYNDYNEVVCEYVGSNGTREPQDDLHSEYEHDIKLAYRLYNRWESLNEKKRLRSTYTIGDVMKLI